MQYDIGLARNSRENQRDHKYVLLYIIIIDQSSTWLAKDYKLLGDQNWWLNLTIQKLLAPKVP